MFHLTWDLRMFTRKAGITQPFYFTLLNFVYALRHPSSKVRKSGFQMLQVFPNSLEEHIFDMSCFVSDNVYHHPLCRFKSYKKSKFVCLLVF